jgi:hypothetical protein
VKSTVTDKRLTSITVPTKTREDQTIRIPPEAPLEGAKAKLSRFLGANFLMSDKSKWSLLVS